jgi:uncharacterized protein YlzI (FlbEa/FlbD family)
MMNRKLALINYLKEGSFTQEEIEEGYDSCIFLIQGEYMVLNEQERNEKVKEYIQETLWAFRSSFLAKETGLPEKVFHALTEQCESGNDAILALIEKTCGLDAFVDSAVEADGYAHFLASYDGEEEEVTIEGENYFIYRIN